MRILVTNDDGFSSKGIYALVKTLEADHEVIVAAPDNQRSACGHSITLTRPLIVKEVKLDGIYSKIYCIDGTPADCVRIALDRFVGNGIDIVISGINNGYNLGTDVLYSGTVSAAIEAALYEIPSIAVSTGTTDLLEDYFMAAKYLCEILEKVQRGFMKGKVVLNVNIPLVDSNSIKGIKVCKIGNKSYDNYFLETYINDDELGYEARGTLNEAYDVLTDRYYIKEDFITLTPLHYDLTNFKLLREAEVFFEDMT